MFNPAVLHPDPPPWFTRELRLIDPTLRIVWGYDRYLVNKWVLERKLSPERYHAIYASLFRENIPRFVTQPIYDTDRPIYGYAQTTAGEFNIGEPEEILMGYEQVGVRQYDLAPEWEWIATLETPKGEFKQPGPEDLVSLRRQYAWNYTHPLSRARFEQEEAEKAAAKEKEQKQQRVDAWMESIEQAWSEHGKRVTVAVP